MDKYVHNHWRVQSLLYETELYGFMNWMKYYMFNIGVIVAKTMVQISVWRERLSGYQAEPHWYI